MEHTNIKTATENFLARHKFIFILIAVVILVLGITIPVFLSFSEKKALTAIREIEKLEEDYSEFIASYNFYKQHEDIPEETLQALDAGYNEIIANHPDTIAAQKAAMHLATLYNITQDFEKSAVNYEQALEIKVDSYFKPRILFDLGSVYENLGRDDDAVAKYQQLVDEHPTSLEAPHAMFNLGRLKEKISGDINLALGFYTQLINNQDWRDSPFVNIAKSRLALINKLENVSPEEEVE